MKYILLLTVLLSFSAFASEFDDMKELADQGIAYAQSNLGVMYSHGGYGVPKNDKKAAMWFRKAAEQGNAEAQYNLGATYDSGDGVPENDKTAANWFRKAAEQGHATAQYNLGSMYHNGEGVPENDKTAAIWFRKAAEQGYAEAQYNLGNMYDNGEGVPENHKIAVMWFGKAAEQSIVSAQYNLALMYASGKGVPENFIKAHAWYSMAKANGHESAKKNLEILKADMTQDQIAEAQALASKCYESNYKDCESGHEKLIVAAQEQRPSDSYACTEAKRSLQEWQKFMKDDAASRALGSRRAMFDAGGRGGIGALAGAALKYDAVTQQRARDNLIQKQQLRSRLIDLGC